ncbi:MAG TPA: SpoIIE family protein phosphatase [Pseudomonadales bacterium]|nr:SpoIIE family protein phosphatase [Pseudomonadales bacterium]
MKLSITLRLVLWMIAAAVSVYATAGWYNYQLARGHIISESRLQAAQVVNSVVSDLTVNLQGVKISTDLFAIALSEDLPDKQRLQSLLQKTVIARTDISGATVATNPGVLQDGVFAPYYYHPGAPYVYNGKVSYADLSLASYQLESRDWFSLPQKMKHAIWSLPYFDKGGANVMMVTYSVPLISNGKILGVVTADLTMERLHNYLARIRFGSHGFAMMVSQDGLIISHPDKSLVLESLDNVYPLLKQDKNWQAIFSGAVAGEKGVKDLPCPHVHDTCLVGFSTLADTGWILVVLYPKNDMMAGLNQHSFQVLLIAIAGILALLVAVFLISRRLTLPLVALAEVSRRLGSGDLYIPLPVAKGDDEISRLVSAFASMREQLSQFICELEKETASRNRLQGELDAASQIQMEMLPGNGSGHLQREGLSVWAHVIPAKSVGGDLYTWLDIGQRQQALVVGDVSDKGVPAALFMARTLTLLQQYAGNGLSPAEVMTRLNDNLAAHNDACMFTTLFYGVINMDSGLIQFVSAGHTPPMLRRAGKAMVLSQEHGPALGLCESANYPVNSVQLQDGDMLCVYTDGIDEAFNFNDELFGHDRLKAVLESSKDDCAVVGQSILDAVLEFVDGAPQSDDITLLLANWRAPQKQPLLAGHDKFIFEILYLPAELLVLETLFTALDGWLQKHQCNDADLLYDLKLVAEEIFANIVNYGQLAAGDTVSVLLGKGEKSVLMEFIDHGIVWNPLDDSPEPELGLVTEEATIGGLGVFLVKELTDEQAYRRENGANRFCVLKYLAEPPIRRDI